MILKKFILKIINYLNKLLPKYNQVFVQGFPNTESSAISVANYIHMYCDIPVYYFIHGKEKADPRSLLLPGITVIVFHGPNWKSINYLLKIMTSKFIFFTHSTILPSFSDRQTVTNIWHGVLYKKVGLLNGEPPRRHDITVGTSQATKKMFSAAFGVSENSVYISGYPRNDMLLEAKKNREGLKKDIKQLSTFEKVAIWMPTYRKSERYGKLNGVEVGNPFYIKNFDTPYFNELLKKDNTICLVKPHPGAPAYEDYKSLSNVLFIDDRWVSHQGITLYQLLGCTDVLISDVSSVIIDYMLLDQPIICVSTDFEEYRKTRGFYFDDIKNWIPSRINTTQEEFFTHLENVLKEDADPSKEKRKELKKYFFDNHDAHSTERLVNYVLKVKTD